MLANSSLTWKRCGINDKVSMLANKNSIRSELYTMAIRCNLEMGPKTRVKYKIFGSTRSLKSGAHKIPYVKWDIRTDKLKPMPHRFTEDKCATLHTSWV